MGGCGGGCPSAIPERTFGGAQREQRAPSRRAARSFLPWRCLGQRNGSSSSELSKSIVLMLPVRRCQAADQQCCCFSCVKRGERALPLLQGRARRERQRFPCQCQLRPSAWEERALLRLCLWAEQAEWLGPGVSPCLGREWWWVVAGGEQTQSPVKRGANTRYLMFILCYRLPGKGSVGWLLPVSLHFSTF